MSEATDIKVGDWIRFYADGQLVIGVVQYIQEDVLHKLCALTDIGSVGFDRIIESRR